MMNFLIHHIFCNYSTAYVILSGGGDIKYNSKELVEEALIKFKKILAYMRMQKILSYTHKEILLKILGLDILLHYDKITKRIYTYFALQCGKIKYIILNTKKTKIKQ